MAGREASFATWFFVGSQGTAVLPRRHHQTPAAPLLDSWRLQWLVSDLSIGTVLTKWLVGRSISMK